MKHKRILAHLINSDFAMLPSAYETILSIVTAGTEMSDEQVSSYDNKISEVQYDGNIGIMRVDGALIKRGDMFSQVSGLSSYDTIAKQFKTLNDDTLVETIVLHITSQGGEVNGLNDLADAIYSSNKRTIAFIDDLGASAGYWLASAFKEVYANETAMIGSIGVIASYRATEDKAIQIVSSNAPDKNVDISTAEGQEKVKERLDAIEEVFISKVATHRGVSMKDVESNFGRGGVKIASDAKDSNMIDDVMSYGELLQKIKGIDMTESQSKLFALLEGEKTVEAKAELTSILAGYGVDLPQGETDAKSEEEVNKVEDEIPELIAYEDKASIIAFAGANREYISFEDEAKFVADEASLETVRAFAIERQAEDNKAAEDVSQPLSTPEEAETALALAVAKKMIGE